MFYIVVIQGVCLLTLLGCVLGLLFCDIRYSKFTGEAAEHIHDCQRKLKEMYR